MASYLAGNLRRDTVTLMLSKAEAEALRDLALFSEPSINDGLPMNGSTMAGTGATLESLRQAGWVSGVIHDFGGAGAPFRMGRPVTMWQITDAGREAIRQCPDIFPGEPVYGRKP